MCHQSDIIWRHATASPVANAERGMPLCELAVYVRHGGVSSERPLVQGLMTRPDVLPSQQRASHDVERLNLGGGGWTGVILVGQQCPHHGVTRLPVGGADPVTERRLVAEAKLARHCGAPHIV